jgi:hypothetical protein
MDIAYRKWWIRVGDKEEGPIEEEAFQERLRAGKISLSAVIKSNQMDDWQPLLTYISSDETFRRPSRMPASVTAPSDSGDDKPSS